MNIYKDPRLAAVSDCARAVRFGRGEVGVRGFLRLLTALPVLIRFLWEVPRSAVALSRSPAGALIAEHLGLRRWGVPRFRLAQGVLHVPADFSTYLRGRSRQALRTNMRRARERGIECRHVRIADWTPRDRKLTRSAPVERWWAQSAEGATVAEAMVTVDDECALLHTMGSTVPYARWLLHAAIVERLSASGCRLLLTNSFDVPLLSAGQQHFQHLSGYSVACVRPRVGRGRGQRGRLVSVGSLASVAVAAIVAQEVFIDRFEMPDTRALIWLTMLTAVRVAAGRAGWATLVGAVAGGMIALLSAAPNEVAFAYFLGGVALDAELRFVPRLGQSTGALMAAGATVMFVTLIAPGFPTLGHHPPRVAWPIPPALGAIVFGGLAAALGHAVGKVLRPRVGGAAPV